MTKSAALIFICLVSAWWASIAHAEAPREIAGFILGDPITSCIEHLNKQSEMPIRYRAYLREFQIKPMGGFKTGLVTYENCAQPGRIVRIKMKYADSSKAFFQKLLKRYKASFGTHPEWRGDPFHITLAWKWSFTDKQGNRISMILQHNLKDQEEKRGNSVKLTLISAMEEARACFEARQADAKVSPKMMDPIDWEQLIPR